MPTIKNANSLPQNALNRSVTFTTTNLDNGTPFSEPFIVTGPTGSFNNPLNIVTYGGNKILIPLTTNTSEGANYLKIWLPQPSSNKMYITFAKKANSMSDGYYDYINGIPSAYRADLRSWILDGTSVPITQAARNKTLVFEAIGKNTNQAQETIQFRVDFSGLFTQTANPTGPTSQTA